MAGSLIHKTKPGRLELELAAMDILRMNLHYERQNAVEQFRKKHGDDAAAQLRGLVAKSYHKGHC